MVQHTCTSLAATDSLSRYLDLAVGITEFFLRFISPTTHLVPDEPGFNRSYLDANTDFTVSLAKLAAITQKDHYRETGKKILEGILTYHQGTYGFYRDVDLENGRVIDSAIETRFVSLLLKALLLYRREMKINGETGTWSLFRDR